jgi:hypothetical protein
MNLTNSMELERLRTGMHTGKVPKIKRHAVQPSALLKTLQGSKSDLDAWRKRWMVSNEFVLAVIRLSDVGSISYGTIMASANKTGPLIIDKNINKVGKTASSYYPKTIVIEGTSRHSQVLASGDTHVLAWVGAEASKNCLQMTNLAQRNFVQS